MIKKNLIFLTGFMGSGKSVVGKILANTIGYDFTDLDGLIESQEGKKITFLFKEKGEEYFREKERTAIRTQCQKNKSVISLGGGAVIHQPTLDLIKESGFLVYLRAETENIYRRLKLKADRPMLRDENGELMAQDELMLRITTLMERREPFYLQAHLVLHTDGSSVGKTVDTLVKQLKPYIEM